MFWKILHFVSTIFRLSTEEFKIITLSLAKFGI